MNRLLTLAAISEVLLSGCAQLPQNVVVPINSIPTFDSSSIVSSSNGILAADIAKIPGTICWPDDQGLCDSKTFLAGQYFSTGSKVNVTAPTTVQPSYDSLLDNMYSASGNVPFLSASGSLTEYDEIKATTVGTATFDNSSPNAGFPGLSAIQAALTSAGAPPSLQYVYWISAANTIAVSRDTYTKVNSTAQVTGTAFGANGMTYNDGSISQETVWIGLFAHKIYLNGTPNKLISSQNVRTLGQVLRNLPALEKIPFVKTDSKGRIASH
jgi:hypothetical protein